MCPYSNANFFSELESSYPIWSLILYTKFGSAEYIFGSFF